MDEPEVDIGAADTVGAHSVDRFLRDLAEAPPVEPGDGLRDGEVIGGSLRVIRKIGEGGMGVVYLAHDDELDRPVAVKVQLGGRGSAAIERLAREARAMARLSHPNVVPVHEVGEYRGRLYIAMEFVDGGTATQWVEAEPRTWSEIVELYIAAGRGLAAAHTIGLVHRDFKPDNVLVGVDGRPRVADFGLARPVLGTEAMSGGERSSSESTTGPRGVSDSLRSKLTRTGAAVGTMAYMAPEQHGGGVVDAHADQFSFCVALFEALCGTRPFSGRTPAKLLHNIHTGKIREPLADRRVPAWVLRALVRGLSADPRDRFTSMAALLSRLSRRPRSRGRILVSVAALGGAGIAGAALTGNADANPCEARERELTDIWSEQTRAEVEAAFANLDKAYAYDALEKAREPLGAYAHAWGAAYRSACETTLVRNEQPEEMFHKRVACLDRGRRAFLRVVDALRDVDTGTAVGLVDTVHSLPALEPCADLEALAALQPFPRNRRAQTDIQRLEERLADVAAIDAITEPDAKVTGLEQLLRQAEATKYRPLIGRVRVRLAMARFQTGFSEEAELARSAFHDALASADNDLALSAVTVLVRVNAATHPEESHRWAQTGRALLETLDDPTDITALVRSDAIAYSLDGNYGKAVELFEEALAAIEDEVPDHALVRAVYADLAKTFAIAGDIETARTWGRKALDATVRAVGPNHPNVAELKADQARMLLVQSDYEGAGALLDEALGIVAASLGRDHVSHALIAVDLADVHWTRGDATRAIELLRPSIELLSSGVAEERRLRTDAEVMLGSILTDEGRFDEARAILEQALNGKEGGRPSARTRAYTFERLALLEAAEGNFEAARTLALQAISQLEESGVEVGIASPSLRLGEVELELGNWEAAAAAFSRTIADTDRTNRVPLARAGAQLGLARTIVARGGDLDEARKLAQAALEFATGRPDSVSRDLVVQARLFVDSL